MQASLKTSLSNFVWLISERALRVGLGFAVGVAVARYLGPEAFGAISYALAFSAIFGVVAGLGMDEVLVRRIAQDRAHARDYLYSVWQLRCVAAVVTYGATMGVAWLWRPGDVEAWAIVAIVAAGILFSPAEVVDAWFQSSERMRIPTLARQAALIASALVKLGLILMNASVWAFAVAAAGDALLSAVALGLVWKRDHEWRASSRTARIEGGLLRESWPLLVSGLMVVLAMQADRLWLARMQGDAAAGVYSVAARITEIFHALPVTLGTALLPRLASLYASDMDAYWRLVRRATLGLVVLTVAVALVISMTAHYLIPWLFGSRYEAAAAVLAIHVWTLVFVGLVSLRSRLLIVATSNRSILLMSVATVALNFAGNAWLVPRLGIVGAAYSALVAWGVSALVLPWFFPAVRPVMRMWCGLALGRRTL